MMRFACVVSMLTLLMPLSGRAASPAELLDSLPQGTIGVFTVNYDQLRQSSLFALLEQQIPLEQRRLGFDHFHQLTGLDPEHDIESWTCALLRRDEPRPGVACAVSGRFSRDQIAALLERLDEGSQLSQPEPFVWQFAGQNADDDLRPRGMLALPRDGVAYFGDAASVQAVLQTLSGRQQSLAATAPLLSLIRNANSQIRGALDLSTLDLPSPPSGSVQPALDPQRLERVQFELELADDMRFALRLAASNAVDADRLRQAVLGALGSAKLAAGDEFAIQALLAELSVSRAGSDVDLDGRFSARQLREVLEQVRQQMLKAEQQVQDLRERR